MANPRCRCARCRIHGLMGPAVLITIGVLFLVQQTSWRFPFWQTWPVILLVVGAVKLGEALASTEGHVPAYPAVPVQPIPPPVIPPPPPPTAPRV
jgi:hypothetical protein